MKKSKEKRVRRSKPKWNYKLHFLVSLFFLAIVAGIWYLSKVYAKPLKPKELTFMEQQHLKTVRLLEQEKNQLFVRDHLGGLSDFFSIARSLFIAVILSNTIDIFMPMFVFMETFMMLGLLTNNKHYLDTFYYNTFNSKLDFMNLIRMSFSPEKDPNTLEILTRYNFSHMLFFNISGEFFFIIIMLFLTLLVKILQVFIKNQKLRLINNKIRPIWNGIIFYFSPRLLTFSGYQFRSIMSSDVGVIMNTIFAVIVAVGLLIFFALLLAQIKRINSRLEYLDDSRFEIGLARRYDYLGEFQLDCFSFSILYFPALNYFRLFLAFMCIGCSPDFHYLQYGMIILSQSFFFLSHISSSAYLHLRDRIFYTFSQFIVLMLILMVIVVGLAQSVKHSEISVKIEVAICALIITLIVAYFIIAIIDIVMMLFFEKVSAPKGKGLKVVKSGKKDPNTKLWAESNKDEDQSESEVSIKKSKEAKVL